VAVDYLIVLHCECRRLVLYGFPITDLPIGPNPGQQNMEQVGATINYMVRTKMGVLQTQDRRVEHFLAVIAAFFGYNGVVAREGENCVIGKSNGR